VRDDTLDPLELVVFAMSTGCTGMGVDGRERERDDRNDKVGRGILNDAAERSVGGSYCLDYKALTSA
jgi:hypothetical protein